MDLSKENNLKIQNSSEQFLYCIDQMQRFSHQLSKGSTKLPNEQTL